MQLFPISIAFIYLLIDLCYDSYQPSSSLYSVVNLLIAKAPVLCIKRSLVMSRLPFSVPFQINYASLWHHRFEQDEKKKAKNKQQKKSNLLLYFGWRSKQQQVFAHSLFTKEKGARAQKSPVPLERPNFQQSGGTRCCTRYSQLRATGNWDWRQVFPLHHLMRRMLSACR